MSELSDRPHFTVHMATGESGAEEFGYSDGLAETLGHELLMWTRPTEGTDPGLDFPSGKRALQISFWAVLDAVHHGSFAIGTPIEASLRNGARIMRVGAPEMAYAVGADALAPNMLVAPIGWELRRDDFGPLTSIATDQLPRLVAKCEQLFQKLPDDVHVRDDLRVNADRLDEASFSLSGTFGPTTPLVRVVAATIATSADYMIAHLVANVAALREVTDYQHTFDSRVMTIARGAGRSAAVSRCDELARDLARERFEFGEQDKLVEAINATLMTAVVDDLLNERERHRGYGPWETSLYFPHRPPGQEASPRLVDALASLLGPLSGDTLEAMRERYEGGVAFKDLEAYAVSHATGLPEGHSLLERLADATGRSGDDYRDLVTMLLSAASWIRQDGESDEDLSAQTGWWVLDEYGDLIPGLERFVTRGPRPILE